MASRAKETATSSAGRSSLLGLGDSPASLVEANRRAVEHWLRVNQALAKGLLELSQELMQFAQRRFQEDVETNVALARCSDFRDVLECQRRATERATAQYLSTTNTLTTVMSRMARESLPIMPGIAGEGPGRQPAKTMPLGDD